MLALFPKDVHLHLLSPEEQIAYFVLSQLHHYQNDLPFPTGVNLRIFLALFYKKDEQILEAIRQLYRKGLEHLNFVFNEHQLNADFHQSLDYLYSSLCFLPIWEFHLDNNPHIAIPQFIENTWQLVDFEIHSIDITPNQFDDKAYCYGLIPKTQKAPPILIFSGTTYPMGAGALTYFKADLEAFRCVGQSLFKVAQEKIVHWMNSQQIEKINVLGLSLGGAMSLQFSLHLPDRLIQAFALNPPGLYELSPAPNNQTSVRVLIQNHDIVSKFGVWHKHWQIEKITAKDNIPFKSGFLDHTLIYSSFIKKDYTAIDSQNLNKENSLRNLFVFKGLRNLVYLSLMLPTYYVFIPVIKLLFKEKWFVIFSLLLSMLGLSILPSLAIAAFISECIEWKNSNIHKAFSIKSNHIQLSLLALSIISIVPIFFQAWMLAPLVMYFGLMFTLLIDKYLISNNNESSHTPQI